jgi:hypothetical protein
MEALLKKHRGGENEPEAAPESTAGTAGHAAPPDAWLPVLTQVIERGTPPVALTPTAPPEQQEPLRQDEVASATPIAPEDVAPPQPVSVPLEPEPAPLDTTTAAVNDTLAEQLMSELAPRLSEVMEKQVAAELRKNLDQTVANLLSQLDVNVREIVRDAVAEKLKQPRDPST